MIYRCTCIQYIDDTSLLNSTRNLDSNTINTELGKVHGF